MNAFKLIVSCFTLSIGLISTIIAIIAKFIVMNPYTKINILECSIIIAIIGYIISIITLFFIILEFKYELKLLEFQNKSNSETALNSLKDSYKINETLLKYIDILQQDNTSLRAYNNNNSNEEN